MLILPSTHDHCMNHASARFEGARIFKSFMFTGITPDFGCKISMTTNDSATITFVSLITVTGEPLNQRKEPTGCFAPPSS